jgi:hypothetical protein
MMFGTHIALGSPGSIPDDADPGYPGHLESILRNRFGRNLQIKPDLFKFKFLIMTMYT